MVYYTASQLITMFVVGFALGFTLTMLILKAKMTITIGEEDK